MAPDQQGDPSTPKSCCPCSICCCCKLQTGVVLAGLYTFLASSGFVVLLATRNIGQNLELSDVRVTLTYITFILYGLLIPFALLVIVGNIKEKYWLYLPYMVFNILTLIVASLLSSWMVAEDKYNDKSTHDLDLAIVGYHSINLVMSSWCELSVFLHHREAKKLKLQRERRRHRQRRHHRSANGHLPQGHVHAHPLHFHINPSTIDPPESSGFDPDNLEPAVHRRPALPAYLLAQPTRQDITNKEKAPNKPQPQSNYQDHNQNHLQSNEDVTGNFFFGPHVTSINVNQNKAALGGGQRKVSVHREPLFTLPPAFGHSNNQGMQGTNEDDDDKEEEGSEYTEYTNSTQQMVSTLTSLGSDELSFTMFELDSRNKHGKPRSPRHKPRDAPGAYRYLYHQAPSRNRPSGPHPRSPRTKTDGHYVENKYKSKLKSKQKEVHKQFKKPRHSNNEAARLPMFVGRAMRYSHLNSQEWTPHDFGLTDINFSPPKPYKRHTPHQPKEMPGRYTRRY